MSLKMKNRKLIIKNINLENGAILVSDVHYKKGDKKFLSFLNDLIKNPPPQLFLLGDIFHALLPFRYLYEENKEAITLINKLAKKTEVYYAYGNHDFLIDEFFEGVIFADIFIDKEKSFFLSHGDNTIKDFIYSTYIKFLKNKFILNVLNLLSFNFIYPWVFKIVLRKKINCREIPDFKKEIISKITDINFNNIIEGHYHQNKNFILGEKKYWNLGAFFCENVYYKYESNLLKELVF